MMKPIFRMLRRTLVVALTAVLGFVAGAGALYFHQLMSGPDLELWHLQALSEEFSVAHAGEVRDLDDYLQREDRLFAQLDALVYDRTGSGPSMNLARFSPGSRADPRSRPRNWNRTFQLIPKAPRAGFLLLHGMSDSPYSVRALGEFLHGEGYHVVGLRLPGHGTAPGALRTTTWEDMAAAVQLAMTDLHARLGERPVYVLGYSNGGALAVNHVLNVIEGEGEAMPAGLVLVAPAVGVSPAAVLAGVQSRLASLPGLARLAWTDILPEFDPYKYNSFPVNAGQQVHRLTQSLKERVQSLDASGALAAFPPVLVFLSTVDATVSVDAVVDNLMGHLDGSRNSLVLFDLNRAAVARFLLKSDPGPLTERMLADDTLPFAMHLVTNASPSTLEVVRRSKPPRSTSLTDTALGLSWPKGVFSLSHLAVQIPPDDALYGAVPPAQNDTLYLGRLPLQGERGLLLFSPSWLLRIRHNPFYEVLQERVRNWLSAAPAH